MQIWKWCKLTAVLKWKHQTDRLDKDIGDVFHGLTLIKLPKLYSLEVSPASTASLDIKMFSIENIQVIE